MTRLLVLAPVALIVAALLLRSSRAEGTGSEAPALFI